MILDGPAIRRRRESLGLSQRSLASSLGVTGNVIRLLEAGGNHDDLTLGFLTRLAGALAVEPTTLLSRPTDEQPSGPVDAGPAGDAAQVGALLQATGVLTPKAALCDSTGWNLGRLEEALDRLEQLLPGVGLRLHRLQNRVTIERSVEASTPDNLKTIVRKHLARDGLNLTEGRLLRQIQTGNAPRDPTNPETVALGVLLNACLILEGDAAGPASQPPWTLAPEVAASLHPQDKPR